MRRRFQCGILFTLFLACLCAFACGESDTVLVDGVKYELDGEYAWIVGIEEGAVTITVHPQIMGLDTLVSEMFMRADETLQEIVFAQGITSIDSYHQMISRVRRIAIPGSYDPVEASEEYYGWWSFIKAAEYLEMIILPADISEELVRVIVQWARDVYDYSQYDILDILSFGDPLDPSANRMFHSIKIDPMHPTLYDIDGIVYKKGVDELLVCLPGRVGAVDVPEGTKSIGDWAFGGCDQVESVTLPRSVTSVGRSAFYACGALRTIQLPPTLERVGVRAFVNCISLTTLVVPDGVTIEEGAFDYCASLRAVYLQGSHSVIDPSAFTSCHADLTIYARENSPGYTAAALSGTLWAEVGGVPQRLPNPDLVHKQPAYVHAEDETALLTLYTEPTSASNTVAMLPVGTTVDVLDTKDGWARVWLYEGEGYLPLDQLRLIDPNVQLLRIISVQTEDEDIRLYAGPSTESESVEVNTWHRYPVVQQFGAWYRIDDEGTPWYVRVCDFNSFCLNFDEQHIRIVWNKDGKRAKLYKEKSTQSEVIAELYEGTQLLLLEYYSDTSFWSVSYEGDVGYITDMDFGYVADEWFYYAY